MALPNILHVENTIQTRFCCSGLRVVRTRAGFSSFQRGLRFFLLQLNAFRSMRMKTPEECCSEPHGGPQLVNNYRPPLPLGNRVLRECGEM